MMSELPKIVVERLRKAPVSPHPDADVLTAFSEQRLIAPERESLLAHLAECGECRDIVSLAQPVLTETQAVATAPKARPSEWRVWQWGAITAGVVVIAGAVWLNRDLRESPRRFETVASVTRNAPTVAAPATAAEQPQVKNEVQAQSSPAAKVASEPAASPKLAANEQRKSEPPPVMAAADTRMYQRLPQKEVDQLSLREADASRAQEEKQAASGATLSASNSPVPAAPASTLPAGANEAAKAQSTETIAKTQTTGSIAGGPAAAPGGGYLFRAHRMPAPPPAPPAILEKKKEAVRDEKDKSASMDYSLADSTSPNVEIAQSSYAGAQVTVGKDSLPATMRLTDDGELQERSGGAASRWQNLDVKKGDKLRVIALRGQEIWVGGEQGLLYRSTDAGKSWKQVDPGTRGKRILELKFRDLQHGELKTQDGEIWDTSDGGDTWRKQR
jgi:hypothetical protein